MLIKIINDTEDTWYNGLQGLILYAWDMPGTDLYGCSITYPVVHTMDAVPWILVVKKEDSVVWQR